jgi:hypothetical protein
MAWAHARGLVIRQGLGVLVVAVTVAVPVGAAQGPSPGTRADEDAIKAVIATTTGAFSRHDAKAWVKFCTPDAQLVTVRGESMRGVAEIEKGIEQDLRDDERPPGHAQDLGCGSPFHPARCCAGARH